MRKGLKLFFPMQDKESIQEIEKKKNYVDKDEKEILESALNANPELLLEEARRIYDEEEERRRVADSKATTYLLVIAALIPVLTYFEGVIWGDKIGTAPRWLAFFFMMVALLYILAFGYWALKTMRLAAYYRLGVGEAGLPHLNSKFFNNLASLR